MGAQGLFILGFSLSVEVFLISINYQLCLNSSAFTTDRPHQIVGMREGLPCLPWISFKVLAAIFIHIPFALGQVTVTGIMIDDSKMFSFFLIVM